MSIAKPDLAAATAACRENPSLGNLVQLLRVRRQEVLEQMGYGLKSPEALVRLSGAANEYYDLISDLTAKPREGG